MPALVELKHYLSQIPGWHTRRHLVVIESDDWGSIRMPSKQVYEKLLKQGYRVDRCHFSHYDSLETEDDLVCLFEVLDSVRDSNNKPAVLTANCVVANPDFDKIEAYGFQEYYYESVLKTYKRQPGCSNCYNLTLEGINSGVWMPQSHGREHLNSIRWMKALQVNDGIAKLCFNDRHFSLTTIVSPKVKARYMDAFANADPATLSEEQIIVIEALDQFEHLYGFRSESFIAPCYIWRSELEKTLHENGVKFLQGLAYQQIPISDEPIKCKSKYHKLGEYNQYGQIYLTRNAFFEPYKGGDWVGECMHRIDVAFKCFRPAIISSHRLNFIGAIETINRDNHLIELKILLNNIIKQWPDVEFISSDQLGHIINGE